MSFYDILKAAKVGGNLPSYYETLFARKLPCSKFAWQETTLSGVPPLSFSAKGTALSAYSVTGNLSQTGTPTPTQPVTPEECGDLVTTGEHAGEYAIPLSVSGTSYPLYLSEPLRKIGDYADTVDSSGVVTRRIKRLVLTGSETFTQTVISSGYVYGYAPEFPPNKWSTAENIISTHYKAEFANRNGNIYFSGSQLMIDDFRYDTTTDFKQFLADENTAGHPVCVWYVLASPVTETTTAPTITPSAGSNTLTVGTTLAPSEVSITGKIKEV